MREGPGMDEFDATGGTALLWGHHRRAELGTGDAATVGRRVRELREAVGLSPADLAGRVTAAGGAPFTAAAVELAERGGCPARPGRIGPGLLARLATALGVTPTYLLTTAERRAWVSQCGNAEGRYGAATAGGGTLGTGLFVELDCDDAP